MPQLDGNWDGPAASLLGAEALVGKLHVHSPDSAVSPDAGTNEPETPKTPEVVASSSQDESTQGPPERKSEEITPKASHDEVQPPYQYSRSLPHFYHNANNSSAHKY